LAKLGLLEVLSTDVLADVACVLRRGQSLLSTLRFQRTELRACLAHLTSGGQAQLALLASGGQLSLAHVLGKPCTLHTQLAQLLGSPQRANACLTQSVGSLKAQLSTLNAKLALHLLVGQSGLLLIGQVGQVGLETCLSAQLLSLQLSAQVLLADRKASLLVCLLSSKPGLLFGVELLLGLLVRLLETGGLNASHLGGQIALTLGLDNCLTAAAKRANTNGSCLILSTLNLGGALRLSLLYGHDFLHVRGHEGLCRSGLREALGADLLRGPHLEGLQIGAVSSRCGLRLWGSAELSSLLCLCGCAEQGTNAELVLLGSLIHGLLTLQRALLHAANALLEALLLGSLLSQLGSTCEELLSTSELGACCLCLLGRLQHHLLGRGEIGLGRLQRQALGRIKVPACIGKVAHACASDIGQIA
jgi:hypothetical protein